MVDRPQAVLHNPAVSTSSKVIASGFAERLKAARHESGLSIRALAEKVGITHQSVVGYEAGRGSGARLDIVGRLAEALHIAPSWLAYGTGPRFIDETSASMEIPMLATSMRGIIDQPSHFFIAPGFDPILNIRELARKLGAQGGYIEQSYLYSDPMSAACWVELSAQEDYFVAAGQSTPLDQAADYLVKYARGQYAGLDIIALGCGDGRREVRLVQNLLERELPGRIRLYLLDISQPLLSVAHKHASETFLGNRRVTPLAIQANMHDLPRYTHLFHNPTGERHLRVCLMFGYTFGNLENEVLFVRNSLLGFSADDLLVFNVTLASSPADRPTLIQKTDSLLCGQVAGVWKRRQDEWLGGPIKRYADNVKSVEIIPQLDTACCTIPGSYAIELRAHVKGYDRSERQFAMMYVKRYHADSLLATMESLGWESAAHWKYTQNRRMLAICRRAS